MKNFNIKKWQDKTLNEAPAVRGLEKLKDNYYGISDEIYDTLHELASFVTTQQFKAGSEQAKLIGGRLLDEILSNFIADDFPVYNQFSAHDVTVSSLLSVLGVQVDGMVSVQYIVM